MTVAAMPPFDRVRGKGLRRRRRAGEASAVPDFPPGFLLREHRAVPRGAIAQGSPAHGDACRPKIGD